MTLIEMLVVLALFGIVAGAVVLALPGGRSSTAAQSDALDWVADLDRAVDLAMTRRTPFALAYDGEAITFVQPAGAGQWRPHSDAHLGDVKLIVAPDRISITENEVFSVSDRLVPELMQPLRLVLGAGAGRFVVLFDGARAVIEVGS